MNIGGTVRIFGSNDADIVFLADVAGKISFDGSFNRGGDFIILPNAATSYSVVRSGSSITLNDADSQITIPVGTKGATLQFADGEAVLKYDGQVLLGSQVITSSVATVTATLTTKTALPATANTLGTLIMAQDEPVLIGGNVKIFGTNGADTVTIADVAGNIAFDGSFNRGADTIILNKLPETYSVARPNASNVTIGNADTKLTIPLGTKGLNVQFSNETRTLVYNSSNAYLGNQIINKISEQISNKQENTAYYIVENAFSGSIQDVRSDYIEKHPEFDSILSKQPRYQPPAIIDVNGDGYNDIILQLWYGFSNQEIGTVDGPNKIIIFINHGGKYFTDETSNYLIGNSSIEAISPIPTVADINRDGFLDVFYGANKNEDGRIVNYFYKEYMSPLSGLISKNGKYELVSFGYQSIWGYLGNTIYENRAIILGHGDASSTTKQIGYYLDSGNIIEFGIEFPYLNRAFQFFDDGKSFTHLVQEVGGSKLQVEAWKFDGAWSKVGTTSPGIVFLSDIDIFPVKNSLPYKASVIQIDDNLYAAPLSYNASVAYHSSEQKNNTVIMMAEMVVIQDYDPKNTKEAFYPAAYDGFGSLVFNIRKLFAFEIYENSILYKKVNLYGYDGKEELYFISSANNISAQDINGDGRDDIIIHDYNSKGNNIIYINISGLDFARYNLNIIGQSEQNGSGETSYLADFNNDGVLDLLSIPEGGQEYINPLELVNFHLYIASNNFHI